MSASVLPLTDLTVTAPAASQDLTELITFKQELGLSDSDALLARLVSEASAMVAGHCRRIFAREGLLERLLLTSGRSPLLLSRYPVAALDSVALDGRVKLPGDESGPRDLPQEVERATLELAKSLWFARLRDPQLDSEDLPGVYKAVYGRSALPAQVISLLAPYRTRQI